MKVPSRELIERPFMEKFYIKNETSGKGKNEKDYIYG